MNDVKHLTREKEDAFFCDGLQACWLFHFAVVVAARLGYIYLLQ